MKSWHPDGWQYWLLALGIYAMAAPPIIYLMERHGGAELIEPALKLVLTNQPEAIDHIPQED